MPPGEVRIIAVAGLPEVVAGDDVGAQIADSADAQGTPIEPGDVVVIAHKIVSKAEGRLADAVTREDARALARREAKRVVRESSEHLITETQHGLVCANSGVDLSNAPDGKAVLLPRDPDASARRIGQTLVARARGPVAVIVSDTFGRAWRIGQINVAIGSWGIEAVRDHRGDTDPEGREMAITQVAHIDELASAAELVQGKIERVPVAIVRGYAWEPAEGRASDLVRPPSQDLFR